MRKLLRPKDVLLLGLGGIIDLAEELHDPFGLMEEGTKQIYGFTPRFYKHHNVSRMVLRQIRTGNIERVIKNGQVYLRLTSAGKEKIKRDFPMLSLTNRRWDKKWRVVIFDISEVNRNTRDVFRIKLKELGFGMLQESVWITPYDITRDMAEFLESRKLDGHVFILEVGALLAGDRDFLIEKIWHLSDINSQYVEIISEVKKLLDMSIAIHDRDDQSTYAKKANMLDTNKIQKESRNLKQKYLQVLLTDPCLPKELLPTDWAGEKARKVIRKLPKIV